MRDLKIDKEICDKATPGPWKASGDINHMVFAKEGISGEPIAIIADCGKLHHADTKEHVAEIQANAEFIAAAREGWPEAINRAIAAEELVALLQNELVRSTAQDEEWHCEFGELREVCDEQRDSIQQLSAQVAGYRNILKVIRAGCTPFLKTSDLAKDIAYACYKALNNPDPGAEIMERMKKLEAVAQNAWEYRRIEETREINMVKYYAKMAELDKSLADLEGGR